MDGINNNGPPPKSGEVVSEWEVVEVGEESKDFVITQSSLPEARIKSAAHEVPTKSVTVSSGLVGNAFAVALLRAGLERWEAGEKESWATQAEVDQAFTEFRDVCDKWPCPLGTNPRQASAPPKAVTLAAQRLVESISAHLVLGSPSP